MKMLVSVLALLLAACQTEKTRTTTAEARAPQESKQDMTSGVTSRDGTRIAFDKTGSGPALIVVSGALSQRSLLAGEPLIPTLAEHFTVYIYDRRGRGESTDVKPYAVEREIEDIDALVTDAGGSAYLYGVSSGAALSLQTAAKLGPAKVTKVAIYDAPYGQEKQAFAKQKDGVNERVRTGKPGDAAEFFLSSIGTPPEALEGMKRSPAWEAMKKMDFTLAYDYEVLGDGAVPEDVVKTIRVPALVMTGGNSMDFMQSAADRIAALIPDAQRKTLEGQAHQAAAEVVVPVLVEFFTGPRA